MIEKSFDRNIKVLNKVFRFLEKFISVNDICKEDAFALQIAAEELFTNLVKYNQNEPDKIRIGLEKSTGKIILTFIDSTKNPFQLKNAKPYDTGQSLEERPVGKIGIHLIQQYMDDVEQEYENNKSTIRLIKNLRQ